MLRPSLGLLGGAVLLIAACGNASEPADVPLDTVAEDSVESTLDAVGEVDSATRATHARLVRMGEEEGLSDRPLGEIIQRVAQELLGTPYVERMLDQDDHETLVISLAGFDCVLFNESVVAMSQAIRARDPDFDTFSRNVEALRYRDGRMADYCSRLHYYSDWLRDNDRRGTIRIVTDELTAAEPFEKTVYFMTEHREAYRQLVDEDLFMCISTVQDDLNEVGFSFVPQERIEEVYDQLEPGDILALTTGVAGLDVAHTGLVYRHADGRVGIIHASSTGEVKIDPDLATYVRGIRTQNGIMVARAL